MATRTNWRAANRWLPIGQSEPASFPPATGEERIADYRLRWPSPSSLRDANATPVEIHQKRCGKADRKIDRHGDRDHLYGLTGNVQYATGKNLHQIGITDCNRKRRVLDQVEILIGQRRHDH